MNFRTFLTVCFAVTIVVVGATVGTAQCPVATVAGGLRAPTKIILSTKGSLLVTESGNGTNTGRISIIDAATGVRRTLIDGLPAAFGAPGNDPAGPSGLVMRGRTLYVAIGAGDEVLNGSLPGSFVPNPNPSSPLFSSVLAIHFSGNVEMNTAGYVLSFADQIALKNGSKLDLTNGDNEKITIELLVDFPDYVPEPRPGLPNAVRQSNPFGLALYGDDHLYVADASANSIRSVDLETGSFSTFTTFGPLPNNRGFGPPVVEAVPDSIHLVGDQFLITLLSGFPFPIGNAQVRAVNPDTGASVPFITGLTSAIDVLPAAGGGFFTLEFSADMLVPLPGRLRYFSSPSASPTTVSDCLITPTSMAQDSRTADVYVTEIATGRVVKVTL